MVWPYTTPKVLPLEGVLQITAPSRVPLPAVILTSTAVHLFDTQHHVVIASHLRSEESLEKYGKNVLSKLNRQQDIIGISTDKGFLLVYSIVHNDEELLTVYSKSSELLQNGLVLNKQFSFFEKLHIENPIPSYQLRFKVFLKIHHDLKDFLLLDQYEIILVTAKNVQLLNLHTSNDDVVNFEGIPIDKIIHSRPLNNESPPLFFAIDSDNNGRLYSRKATAFTLVDDSVLKDVADASINSKLSLILILHKDYKKISFYNYNLKTTISEIEYNDPIKSIRWSRDNSSFVLLFSNGTWSTNSIFGATFFKSAEFNDINLPWLNQITDIDILSDQSYTLLSDPSNLYVLPLLSNLNVSNTINYNLKRPILISNGEIHIYSTYENKSNNWNIIKVPYEEYHQLVQIYHASLSNDYKFLALSNAKSLIVHSFVANDWSFYINDYNHEMCIGNLTWISKLNLLIMTNKTNVQSELIIFDFKNFNNEVTFDSSLIIFKYDFGSDIVTFNIVGEDILIITENMKYYHFKVQLLQNKGIKIDLIKILSFEKIFKKSTVLQNVLRISPESEDLLIQENNEIIYLKHENNTFEKFLLFDKVEYIAKIDDENYYLFNGDSLILIKELSNLIQNVTSQEAGNDSTLKISTDKEYYPILLNSNNGLFITMENEIITKKTIQLNNILTKSSIFLHDLIKFEINKNSDIDFIWTKYSKFKNFQYSLELLLYQSIEDTDSVPMDSKFMESLITLIKHNPVHELNIVSKCLRKIEIEHWNKLLNKLNMTSDELIKKSIELKQFKTLSILVIIFLNYNDQNKLVNSNGSDQDKEPVSKELKQSKKSQKKRGKGDNHQKRNTNANNIKNDHIADENSDTTVITEEYDEVKLLEILKLIYINAKDEELWDSCFELLRFFKILDKSGELLRKGVAMLESV